MPVIARCLSSVPPVPHTIFIVPCHGPRFRDTLLHYANIDWLQQIAFLPPFQYEHVQFYH
jgi:hypothetical protein